jgi:hypothetical protein
MYTDFIHLISFQRLQKQHTYEQEATSTLTSCNPQMALQSIQRHVRSTANRTTNYVNIWIFFGGFAKRNISGPYSHCYLCLKLQALRERTWEIKRRRHFALQILWKRCSPGKGLQSRCKLKGKSSYKTSILLSNFIQNWIMYWKILLKLHYIRILHKNRFRAQIAGRCDGRPNRAIFVTLLRGCAKRNKRYLW